jgi:hypothetical protein
MERVVGLAMSSACEAFGVGEHDPEDSAQPKPTNGSLRPDAYGWHREWSSLDH